MQTPRLFADFHNADPLGRVRLNCAGTLQDLADQCVRLEEDLEVEIYSEELSTLARVHFSTAEHLWVARIDWDSLISVIDAVEPVRVDL